MFEVRDEAILIVIAIATVIGAYIFYGVSVAQLMAF